MMCSIAEGRVASKDLHVNDLIRPTNFEKPEGPSWADGKNGI
jgi:hypothetical protein